MNMVFIAGLLSAGALASFLWSTRAQAEAISTASGSLNTQSIATFEHPWAIAVLPGGDLLITEKPGRLRRVSNGVVSDPISGVPDVAFEGQGGLLGLTLDPGFKTNNTIYLAYAEAAAVQPDGATDPGDPRLTDKKRTDVTLKGLAIARARLDGASLEDVRVIWRQEPKTIGRGHFGGRMAFAPDGKLFIAAGERQRFEPAQDPKGTLGKVLRINADGSVPGDNPLRAEGRPDVWSIGHRNPLGIAFDPVTDRLWLHEMGPKGGDEFNEVIKGANYGWPSVSEGVHYNDAAIPRHETNTQFKRPALAWNPVISPSGLAFYSGDLFPHWTGKALIGGLSSEALVVVAVTGGEAKEFERVAMKRRIRDVAQGPNGEIYLLGDGQKGELLKLTPGEARSQ